MVGRTAHLERLTALLGSDGPAVALVGGEAGIGKSRLVQELQGRVPGETVALAGQADPGGLSHPFQLLLDAVCDHVDPDDERLVALRPTGQD